MTRKFLTQLFLFLLLLSTWWEVENMHYIATSGKISSPIPVFPSMQVEMLKSADPKIAADALEETARALINYLEPELARETWDCNYLFVDLLPGGATELALTLTLTPDRGVLVLLQKQNNHYILLYYLDNLLPLTKMEKFTLPGGREILATREVQRERIGAYSESRMVKLWSWKDNALHVVWSDNSFWEINWLNTWQNPQSKPLKWYKLVQEAGITYHTEPQPSIVVKAQQSYSECPTEKEILPAEQQFKQLAQREINEEYHWSEEWQRFIITTGTLSAQGNSPAQKVALLKDLENNLEFLAVQDKKLYEVIGSNGKIFLVEKSRLKLDR